MDLPEERVGNGVTHNETSETSSQTLAPRRLCLCPRIQLTARGKTDEQDKLLNRHVESRR